jgi:hypothetical protein
MGEARIVAAVGEILRHEYAEGPPLPKDVTGVRASTILRLEFLEHETETGQKTMALDEQREAPSQDLFANVGNVTLRGRSYRRGNEKRLAVDVKDHGSSEWITRSDIPCPPGTAFSSEKYFEGFFDSYVENYDASTAADELERVIIRDESEFWTWLLAAMEGQSDGAIPLKPATFRFYADLASRDKEDPFAWSDEVMDAGDFTDEGVTFVRDEDGLEWPPVVPVDVAAEDSQGSNEPVLNENADISQHADSPDPVWDAPNMIVDDPVETEEGARSLLIDLWNWMENNPGCSLSDKHVYHVDPDTFHRVLHLRSVVTGNEQKASIGGDGSRRYIHGGVMLLADERGPRWPALGAKEAGDAPKEPSASSDTAQAETSSPSSGVPPRLSLAQEGSGGSTITVPTSVIDWAVRLAAQRNVKELTVDAGTFEAIVRAVEEASVGAPLTDEEMMEGWKEVGTVSIDDLMFHLGAPSDAKFLVTGPEESPFGVDKPAPESPKKRRAKR